MIKEAAMLYVKEGLEGEFEEAFRRGGADYRGHERLSVPFLVQMYGKDA